MAHRSTLVTTLVCVLLSANPELTVNWSSGSTFGNPSAIVPPRIARVGMKAAW